MSCSSNASIWKTCKRKEILIKVTCHWSFLASFSKIFKKNASNSSFPDFLLTNHELSNTVQLQNCFFRKPLLISLKNMYFRTANASFCKTGIRQLSIRPFVRCFMDNASWYLRSQRIQHFFGTIIKRKKILDVSHKCRKKQLQIYNCKHDRWGSLQSYNSKFQLSSY